MRSSYDFRKVIEQIAQQLTHDRPNTATIHSIEGRTVSLTIGGFPSIIRSVRVIGDIDSVSPGQVVDILWDKGRPVVLLGGMGENVVSSAAVRVDNSTLENSWEGMRVKSGGISLRHLNFTPVIEGHNHTDPILNAGWMVDDYGVLFNHKTRLHPDGLITLGDGTEIIKLSSSDTDYRVWVGASAGEFAPFSVDKYGAMRSTLGEIGGWAVGPFKIESDDGKAVIDSRTPHISLGDVTYLNGEGFWVGKHGSVYRLKIGSDTRFLRWDGQDLLIQGSVRSADYVAGIAGWNIDVTGDAEFNDAVFRGEIRIGAEDYLTGTGFWVGDDNGTPKLRIGDPAGHQLTWDGTTLNVTGDFVISEVPWTSITGVPADLNQLFYGPTAPLTGMDLGDYWIDSTDNSLYRYDGGTWVQIQDDDIAQALSDSAQAVADAQAAIGALSDIGLDNVISTSEKRTAEAMWNDIVVEGNPTNGILRSQAVSFSLSVTSFDSAYSALDTYLNTTLSLFTDMTVSTNIDRTAWDTNWGNYYAARANLVNSILIRTSEMADWASVNDKPGYFDTPSGTGLFLSTTHMGYFNNGEWTAVITNQGQFLLQHPAVDDYLIWDGTNLFIQGDLSSGNYVQGISGWHIGPTGDAEFHNVTVRGAIKSAVMEYGQVMAIDGGMIAAKSAAVVAQPFTAISTNFSIFLQIPGGVNPDQISAYFVVGDAVRVKSGAANFWGSVVSMAHDGSYWEIVVSRVDPAWDVDLEAGATLVNYGASGEGAIEIVGQNPSIRMFTHDGTPHDGVDDFLILGDLEGQFGFSTSKLGLGVGDPNKINDYLVITADGVQMSGEILIGAGAFGTGVGFWVGKELGVPKLHIGDPAGQHLTWDGTSLNIVGAISITSADGVENIQGLGALATMDTVNYGDVGGSKPPADATAGATWGVNLLGIPSQLETPSGAGLYLGPEHMGYYDGGQWVTYIDSLGAFHFKGTGENTFLEWNPALNKLRGVGLGREMWYASAADGRLYAGEGSVTLDDMGIRIIGNNAAFYFVQESDINTPVGTLRIADDLFAQKVIRIINGLDASDINLVANGTFDTDTTGWMLDTSNGTAPARSTERFYAGGASLKFTPKVLAWENLLDETGAAILDELGSAITVLNPGPDVIDQAYTPSGIDIDPESQYMFSAQLYYPDKPYMDFEVRLKLYNSSMSLIRTRTVDLSSVVHGTWHAIGDTFVTTASEVYLVVQFVLTQGPGGDDASPEGLFIDSVGLYSLSSHDSQIELGKGYINLSADSVVLPPLNPTSDWEAAPKKYVDDSLSTIDLSGYVDKSSAETIGGVKTFSSIPGLPASNPTADDQAARKKYVDDTIDTKIAAAAGLTFYPIVGGEQIGGGYHGATWTSNHWNTVAMTTLFPSVPSGAKAIYVRLSAQDSSSSSSTYSNWSLGADGYLSLVCRTGGKANNSYADVYGIVFPASNGTIDTQIQRQGTTTTYGNCFGYWI